MKIPYVNYQAIIMKGKNKKITEQRMIIRQNSALMIRAEEQTSDEDLNQYQDTIFKLLQLINHLTK